MRRWLLPALVVGLLATTAAACDRNEANDSLSATYGLPTNQVDAEAQVWTLVPSRGSVAVPHGTKVTLAVDGNTVTGQGPCNRYHGDIDIDGDSVSITKLAGTLKACEEPVMRAEQAFLDALGKVDTIDVSDDELELSNSATLRFEASG